MIRACVFDLGGTIVDRFSITPLLSLKNTFQKQGIFVNDKLIFKDMGKHKLDHIKDILDDQTVSRNWMHKFGTLPGDTDAHMLFNDLINKICYWRKKN
jgi:phosphonoacetaldehyde hydrolase